MKSKGFTLLEILVTIVLLTAGIVSILHAMNMGMNAESVLTNDENITVAKFLAQEKVEEIKDESTYAGIDTHGAAKASMSGNYSNYEREVTVTDTTVTINSIDYVGPKKVDVTVYWTVGGVEKNVTLMTLFANYDY